MAGCHTSRWAGFSLKAYKAGEHKNSPQMWNRNMKLSLDEQCQKMDDNINRKKWSYTMNMQRIAKTSGTLRKSVNKKHWMCHNKLPGFQIGDEVILSYRLAMMMMKMIISAEIRLSFLIIVSRRIWKIVAKYIRESDRPLT